MGKVEGWDHDFTIESNNNVFGSSDTVTLTTNRAGTFTTKQRKSGIL
jgi:hypothetical protein